MSKNGKNKQRTYFNGRAAPQHDVRDFFLESLESAQAFSQWLERNDPSLDDCLGKVTLPRQKIKQKQRGKRHAGKNRKKVVKTVQNRQSRLLLILRAGHLGLLLDHLDKRGETLDKNSAAKAHPQGLPGVLAAISHDKARGLIDHLHESRETVTRNDLFMGGGPPGRPDRMPGTLSLGLIRYALSLSGDRLRKKDLVRHNNSGRTILAEMVRQGHADDVIAILNEDTDRLSVQDLETKRGQGKISILDSLFQTQTPDVLIRLPLRKNKHLSTDIWTKLFMDRAIYRVGNNGNDAMIRMKKVARSPHWMQQSTAAFEAFCGAFDDRTQQAIGIPETRALFHARRVKAVRARQRMRR